MRNGPPSYSQLSPDAAMLFASFGCTHPPPPAPPFLLTQNLHCKSQGRGDIMKLKLHGMTENPSSVGKGLINFSRRVSGGGSSMRLGGAEAGTHCQRQWIGCVVLGGGGGGGGGVAVTWPNALTRHH